MRPMKSLPLPLPRASKTVPGGDAHAKQDQHSQKKPQAPPANRDADATPKDADENLVDTVPDILGLYTENVVKEHGKFFIYNKTKLDAG